MEPPNKKLGESVWRDVNHVGRKAWLEQVYDGK